MKRPKEIVASTKEDFPNLGVFLCEGPMVAIRFWHWEDGDWWIRLKNIAGAALIVAAGIFAGWALWRFGIKPGYIPQGWWALLAVLGAWFAVLFGLVTVFQAYLSPPFLALREIQLDPVHNQFRVYRNGRLEVTRPLDRLHSLTIDEHPKAAKERIKPRTTYKPRRYEKQHALYGWFGAKGAERVMLMSRWEWPPALSLQEVQKAIGYAGEIMAQAEAMVEQERRKGLPANVVRLPVPPKPPLD